MLVGRITKQIEKETKGEIKSGDIRINEYHLNIHIPSRHQKELDQLGIDPISYVKYIADHFTEIRRGSGKSYLLIGPHESEKLKNVAAITLEFTKPKNVVGEDYWEVRTAQPRSRVRMEKRELVWIKK